MSDQPRIIAGAIVGAFVGAAAAYLFFTESGRHIRSQMEPAIDNLSREVARFKRTFERVGGLAGEGVKAFEEFQAARQHGFSGSEPH